mgnify:CR=1 FL=1
MGPWMCGNGIVPPIDPQVREGNSASERPENGAVIRRNQFHDYFDAFDACPSTTNGVISETDVYENLITNISHYLFRSVGKGNRFTITFRNPQYAIHTLSTSYSDVPEGEMLAIFGTSGLLEIAMNRGNASSLLGMEVDDPVRIEFVG